MCDVNLCECKTFSPHLWKAGECRDCHHPIGNHNIVREEPELTLQSSGELLKHVGKLSVDKLEPFNKPEEIPPLTTSGSFGKVRTSITITAPPGDDLAARRLSTNNFRHSREFNKSPSAESINIRRSPSYRSPQRTITEEGESPSYEERLSVSYRKSREMQLSKRVSSENLHEDKSNSKEQQRALVIDELVVTERDYCRDLDYLVQVINILI